MRRGQITQATFYHTKNLLGWIGMSVWIGTFAWDINAHALHELSFRLCTLHHEIQ